MEKQESIWRVVHREEKHFVQQNKTANRCLYIKSQLTYLTGVNMSLLNNYRSLQIHITENMSWSSHHTTPVKTASQTSLRIKPILPGKHHKLAWRESGPSDADFRVGGVEALCSGSIKATAWLSRESRSQRARSQRVSAAVTSQEHWLRGVRGVRHASSAVTSSRPFPKLLHSRCWHIYSRL